MVGSPVNSPAAPVRLAVLVAAAVAAACEGGASAPADGGARPRDARAPTADALRREGGAADARPRDAGRGDIPARPPVKLPRAAITAAELGLIVNESDPLSVKFAAYYQAKRGIPAANVVRLKFKRTTVLSAAAFAPLKAAVDKALPASVQALAIAWMHPYRVGCMSITSAFALGYDRAYCNDRSVTGKPCVPTKAVPYYGTYGTRPYTDLKIRPAMLVGGISEAEVKKLVDRGVAADGTFPKGTGYFIRTTDRARSVRYFTFQRTVALFNRPDAFSLTYIDNGKGPASGNYIKGKKDVLFYFTGLTRVPEIATNTYRPGAVADHLTSSGGVIKNPGSGGQMSVLRWLEAGATGSYGTVVEPCNFTAKFPDTLVFVRHYFLGGTLVEAYWKSVRWPGEGIFVGDPLARPFGHKVTYAPGKITILTTALVPGRTYALLGRRPGASALETVVANIRVTGFTRKTLTIAPIRHVAYELRQTSP